MSGLKDSTNAYQVQCVIINKSEDKKADST